MSTHKIISRHTGSAYCKATKNLDQKDKSTAYGKNTYKKMNRLFKKNKSRIVGNKNLKKVK